MESVVYAITLGFVCIVALGRYTGILVLKVRQRRYARRALALPSSWRDRCTAPEPHVLAVTTVALLWTHQSAAEPSASTWAGAGLGALLSMVAVVLMLWSLAAFPSVSTGHYVLPEHRVVSAGPYRFVRHPLYLAAFLVWLGVSCAFGSMAALVITFLYVVPGYLTYARAEEEMLVAHFGDDYRRYRDRVGMMLPRARPPN